MKKVAQVENERNYGREASGGEVGSRISVCMRKTQLRTGIGRTARLENLGMIKLQRVVKIKNSVYDLARNSESNLVEKGGD